MGSRRQVYGSLVVLWFLVSFVVLFYKYRDMTVVPNLAASGRFIVRGTVHPPYSKPRILCLILTMASSKDKRAAVRKTWGRRCDGRYFLYDNSSSVQNSSDTLILPVKSGRDHLISKMRAAFTHAYKKHSGEFDWILKCDDDTYVIMENLRHLLSHASPRTPGLLGFHMKIAVPTGYMSGGGGYVISSSALNLLVNTSFQNETLCKIDGPDEDLEIGSCLAKAGVKVLSSLDVEGKETFHAESLVHHVLKNNSNSWIASYAWNTKSLGAKCCSRYSTTFHYVKPDEMYIFEQLLYNTTVHAGENTDLENGIKFFNPLPVTSKT